MSRQEELQEEISLLKDIIKRQEDEISLLKDHVEYLRNCYMTAATTANEMQKVAVRASEFLDRVEAYTPVIATGEKMKASPGRKPKVPDEKLLSLHQEGKKNKEIAEETGLSEPTISVRLKKIMEEVR